MKRLTPPRPLEEEMPTSDQTDSDMLTTAAKAIGSTLGKIAVKAGIAKSEAEEPTIPRKAAKKTPAAQSSAGTKPKTASKRSPRTSTRLATDKKPATRGHKGK
jgi:hypothetical protein